MIQPLDGFADRLIRNGEVEEFVRGLIAKGFSPEKLIKVAEQELGRNLGEGERIEIPNYTRGIPYGRGFF